MGNNAMTKSTLTVFTLAIATTLMACNPNETRNTATHSNPDQQEQVVIAQVPQPNNCLQPTANRYGQTTQQSNSTQTQAWVPYARSGFVPYSWNYNGGWQAQPQQQWQQQQQWQYAQSYWSTNGYCGCPGGYIPACDGTVGLVCAPVAQNNGYRYAAYGWSGGGGAGFVFSGYFGYSSGTSFGWTTGHMPTYSYGYGTYSRQRTCHMQVSQSCIVGSNSCGYGSCMPTVAGSPYGVCVTH